MASMFSQMLEITPPITVNIHSNPPFVAEFFMGLFLCMLEYLVLVEVTQYCSQIEEETSFIKALQKHSITNVTESTCSVDSYQTIQALVPSHANYPTTDFAPRKIQQLTPPTKKRSFAHPTYKSMLRNLEGNSSLNIDPLPEFNVMERVNRLLNITPSEYVRRDMQRPSNQLARMKRPYMKSLTTLLENVLVDQHQRKKMSRTEKRVAKKHWNVMKKMFENTFTKHSCITTSGTGIQRTIVDSKQRIIMNSVSSSDDSCQNTFSSRKMTEEFISVVNSTKLSTDTLQDIPNDSFIDEQDEPSY